MNDTCTVYRTADFIGKRWTLNILLEIHKGKSRWKRYNQIKKSLPGITPKILSLRLKELISQELIKKKINADETPIISEYSLTESGEEFIDVIKDMKKWALKWKFKNKACSSADCDTCLN